MRARNVLIVYYSMSGNTARVARDLASRLHADLESLKDPQHVPGLWGQLQGSYHAWRGVPAKLDVVQRDPSRYELTLIGTPVWAWQITPAVRAYLEQMHGKLRNVAFFVTSGDTDVERVNPAFTSVAGQEPIARVGFNEKELRDRPVYESRLTRFVNEMEAAMAKPRSQDIPELHARPL